ncbi:MAG: response regulator [Proteobacteria bacterium]|nr:response regulator [Pseudomonadota bacterium]
MKADVATVSAGVPERGLAGRPVSLVVRAVSPACASLAAIYTILALFHPLGVWLTGSPLAPRALFFSAAATAVGCTGAWLALRGRRLRESAAHGVLFGLGAVVTLNASAYLWLVPDPVHTTNWMLLVLSASLLMLSRRWLLATLAVASGGWLAVASAQAPDAGWLHWGAMLLLTQVLGLTVHEFRLRSTVRLLALHAHAEERSAAANEALAALKEESKQRAIAESDRRASDKRLAEKQRREGLGAMAGGVAHDFNNLLAAILGQAELASKRDVPADVQLALREIQESGERAAHLCRQMLAYAGRAVVKKEPIDLAAVVTESAGLLRAALPKRVQLNLRTGTPAPVVMADPIEIGQVVINLVTNASEALPEQMGVVDVEVHREELGERELAALTAREAMTPGAFGVVRIRDVGSGMDEATRDRMFDPFFSTRDPGRGLGLASAIGIARAHEGGIDVGTEPGRGTQVALYLPLANAVVTSPERHEPRTPSHDASCRVLIVEDEPSVRHVVRRMLEGAGHLVTEAGGARRALAIPDRELTALDVALVDLSMPDGSGIDVAESLRKRNPALRIVLMSGFDREEALAGGRAQGMQFVAKPFRARELLAAIGAGSART